MPPEGVPAGYQERLEKELLVHIPFVDYLSLIERANKDLGYFRYIDWMYPQLWSRRWESVA